ncbi:HATPase domain containing protein [Flavobacteriaceae bacterium]
MVTFDFKTTLKFKSIEYKKDINFVKAQSFFEEKAWDSTLIYSMKQLNSSNCPIELINYCHYFRGSAFIRKKLYTAAEKEFLSIPKSFLFDYKVKIQLGGIYLALNENRKALSYYEEVEKNHLKKLNYQLLSTLYNNIGLCYLHEKKFDKAEFYLLKNQELTLVKKDTFAILYSYESVANLYYDQDKKDKARIYFEKAYKLANNTKDFNFKKMAAGNMAEIESDHNNYSKALVYRLEFEKWNDSINDQNAIWATADFEKKYAIGEKQKQITVLELENKAKIIQRNNYIICSIFLFILFIIGVVLLIQKIKINKIILLQKVELDELNATKDKLFSIVSHDLRSSVTALKTSNLKLIDSLESKKYSELDKLLHDNSAITNGSYNLLDNLLNWALIQSKQLYFQKESLYLLSIVQQVEFNYRPLMLSKNINFEIDICKSIYVFADIDSIKIIIRNVLDNALKFSKEDGKIAIYIRSSEDEFHQLVIEDSGLGMKETTRMELLKETLLLSKKENNEAIGSGLGLFLCKEIISKNDGKLDIESTIDVGTKIILMLPKFVQNG